MLHGTVQKQNTPSTAPCTVLPYGAGVDRRIGAIWGQGYKVAGGPRAGRIFALIIRPTYHDDSCHLEFG